MVLINFFRFPFTDHFPYFHRLPKSYKEKEMELFSSLFSIVFFISPYGTSFVYYILSGCMRTWEGALVSMLERTKTVKKNEKRKRNHTKRSKSKR